MRHPGSRASSWFPRAFAWIALLVLAPNIFLVLYSLWENDLGTVVQHFNLENYRKAIDSEVVRTLFTRTFVMSLMAAGIATAIAYPAAYIVVRKLGRFKLAAALLILVPLWVSFLLRVFAWRIILGERGILNGFLTSTGLLSEPSDTFLYSRTTVVLTLTYIVIPYVFLASYTVPRANSGQRVRGLRRLRRERLAHLLARGLAAEPPRGWPLASRSASCSPSATTSLPRWSGRWPARTPRLDRHPAIRDGEQLALRCGDRSEHHADLARIPPHWCCFLSRTEARFE